MKHWARGKFADLDCIQIKNGSLTLWVTHAVGPRIMGLNLHGRENLLAVVPQAQDITPSGKTYTFRGGHRLWHAPEDPERTYIPDDAPLTVTEHDQGVILTQTVEAETGIEKQISIKLPTMGTRIEIAHTLTNRGVWSAELAPWAITQLKPGGVAILPQPQTTTGLLPNRRLALWPYTQIDSPHILWHDTLILVDASMETGKLKIGWANPDGWLAYWIDNTLFVKWAAYDPTAAYFDFGSSSECYCDPRFLELETLGPRTILEPNQAAVHTEIWQLFPEVNLEPTVASAAALVKELGIGN